VVYVSSRVLHSPVWLVFRWNYVRAESFGSCVRLKRTVKSEDGDGIASASGRDHIRDLTGLSCYSYVVKHLLESKSNKKGSK